MLRSLDAVGRLIIESPGGDLMEVAGKGRSVFFDLSRAGALLRLRRVFLRRSALPGRNSEALDRVFRTAGLSGVVRLRGWEVAGFGAGVNPSRLLKLIDLGPGRIHFPALLAACLRLRPPRRS